MYKRWFTIEQINNLSYLDFTLYTERISSLYEEELKAKEEAMNDSGDIPSFNYDAYSNDGYSDSSIDY